MLRGAEDDDRDLLLALGTGCVGARRTLGGKEESIFITKSMSHAGTGNHIHVLNAI